MKNELKYVLWKTVWFIIILLCKESSVLCLRRFDYVSAEFVFTNVNIWLKITGTGFFVLKNQLH